MDFSDQTDSVLLPLCKYRPNSTQRLCLDTRENISITHKLIKFSKLSNTVSGRNSISLSNKSLMMDRREPDWTCNGKHRCLVIKLTTGMRRDDVGAFVEKKKSVWSTRMRYNNINNRKETDSQFVEQDHAFEGVLVERTETIGTHITEETWTNDKNIDSIL